MCIFNLCNNGHRPPADLAANLPTNTGHYKDSPSMAYGQVTIQTQGSPVIAMGRDLTLRKWYVLSFFFFNSLAFSS